MIERFRLWLRDWLGIDKDSEFVSAQVRRINAQNDAIGLLDKVTSDDHRWFADRLDKLESEVARLTVAQYVPPQPEEQKPKVIQTRTMREYNAILEREFEHEEA